MSLRARTRYRPIARRPRRAARARSSGRSLRVLRVPPQLLDSVLHVLRDVARALLHLRRAAAAVLHVPNRPGWKRSSWQGRQRVGARQSPAEAKVAVRTGVGADAGSRANRLEPGRGAGSAARRGAAAGRLQLGQLGDAEQTGSDQVRDGAGGDGQEPERELVTEAAAAVVDEQASEAPLGRPGDDAQHRRRGDDARAARRCRRRRGRRGGDAKRPRARGSSRRPRARSRARPRKPSTGHGARLSATFEAMPRTLPITGTRALVERVERGREHLHARVGVEPDRVEDQRLRGGGGVLGPRPCRARRSSR